MQTQRGGTPPHHGFYLAAFDRALESWPTGLLHRSLESPSRPLCVSLVPPSAPPPAEISGAGDAFFIVSSGVNGLSLLTIHPFPDGCVTNPRLPGGQRGWGMGWGWGSPCMEGGGRCEWSYPASELGETVLSVRPLTQHLPERGTDRQTRPGAHAYQLWRYMASFL